MKTFEGCVLCDEMKTLKNNVTKRIKEYNHNFKKTEYHRNENICIMNTRKTISHIN